MHNVSTNFSIFTPTSASTQQTALFLRLLATLQPIPSNPIQSPAIYQSTTFPRATLSPSTNSPEFAMSTGLNQPVASIEAPNDAPTGARKARRSRWVDATDNLDSVQNPTSSDPTNPQSTQDSIPTGALLVSTTSSAPTSSNRLSRWAIANMTREKEIVEDITNPPLALLQSMTNPESLWNFSVPTRIAETLTPDNRRQIAITHYQINELYQRMQRPVESMQKLGLTSENNRGRSPSPEPIYDPQSGVRVNTRDKRFADLCLKERNNLVEKMMETIPTYQAIGYKRLRPFRDVPIPVNEHPNYNFSGLIIGPRGATQKTMEADYRCKISVRGRVSNDVKGKKNEHADAPPHVHIEGLDEELVIACAKAIEQLLIVIPDEENDHKKNQLMELSRFNGVYMMEELQERQNKFARAVERQQKISNYNGPEVNCSHCGGNHLFIDCPYKDTDFSKDYDEHAQSLMVGNEYTGDGGVIDETLTGVAQKRPNVHPGRMRNNGGDAFVQLGKPIDMTLGKTIDMTSKAGSSGINYLQPKSGAVLAPFDGLVSDIQFPSYKGGIDHGQSGPFTPGFNQNLNPNFNSNNNDTNMMNMNAPPNPIPNPLDNLNNNDITNPGMNTGLNTSNAINNMNNMNADGSGMPDFTSLPPDQQQQLMMTFLSMMQGGMGPGGLNMAPNSMNMNMHPPMGNMGHGGPPMGNMGPGGPPMGNMGPSGPMSNMGSNMGMMGPGRPNMGPNNMNMNPMNKINNFDNNMNDMNQHMDNNNNNNNDFLPPLPPGTLQPNADGSTLQPQQNNANNQNDNFLPPQPPGTNTNFNSNNNPNFSRSFPHQNNNNNGNMNQNPNQHNVINMSTLNQQPQASDVNVQPLKSEYVGLPLDQIYAAEYGVFWSEYTLNHGETPSQLDWFQYWADFQKIHNLANPAAPNTATTSNNQITQNGPNNQPKSNNPNRGVINMTQPPQQPQPTIQTFNPALAGYLNDSN